MSYSFAVCSKDNLDATIQEFYTMGYDLYSMYVINPSDGKSHISVVFKQVVIKEEE